VVPCSISELGNFHPFVALIRLSSNYMWEVHLLKQLDKHVRFPHRSLNGWL
jgi:hypothetical protein